MCVIRRTNYICKLVNITSTFRITVDDYSVKYLKLSVRNVDFFNFVIGGIKLLGYGLGAPRFEFR
jgi:hypothetical protein